MQKITILDHEHDRVIVAEVPSYLAESQREPDDIAQAIYDALGLSSSNTEYMMGNFNVRIDVAVLNSGKGYGNNTSRLEELVQNFKEDALASLEESYEG